MNEHNGIDLLKKCVENMKKLRQSVDVDALGLFDLTATSLVLATSLFGLDQGVAEYALGMVFCDECGLPACTSFELATGRVLIDGKDCGQSVNLCENHIPVDEAPRQPANCQRVSFYWPEGKPPSNKN